MITFLRSTRFYLIAFQKPTPELLLSAVHNLGGTKLQVGKSRVRFPMRSLDVFNLPNPAALWPWGSTQHLTEMSTRNLPVKVKGGRRVRLTATSICDPIVKEIWEPRRLRKLWASTACYRDSFNFFSHT
jgi:hypothetical protein